MRLYPVFLTVLFAFAAVCLGSVRLFSALRGRRLPYAALSAAFIAAMFITDRLTKIAAESALTETGHIRVIPGVIGYILVHNSGAAWGILSDLTWLLSLFTGITLLVCLYLAFIRRLRSPWLHAALLLVLSGGAGNLYDRLVAGSVTDFLEFLFMDFPIFNFADSCVTVGAVIAVVALLRAKEDEPIFLDVKEKPKAPEEGGEPS